MAPMCVFSDLSTTTKYPLPDGASLALGGEGTFWAASADWTGCFLTAGGAVTIGGSSSSLASFSAGGSGGVPIDTRAGGVSTSLAFSLADGAEDASGGV